MRGGDNSECGVRRDGRGHVVKNGGFDGNATSPGYVTGQVLGATVRVSRGAFWGQGIGVAIGQSVQVAFCMSHIAKTHGRGGLMKVIDLRVQRVAFRVETIVTHLEMVGKSQEKQHSQYKQMSLDIWKKCMQT